MCIICISRAKGKITLKEAWSNLEEIQDSISPEHYDEVVEMLENEELENSYIDLEQYETDFDVSDLDEVDEWLDDFEFPDEDDYQD